jgi:hypothetical protein
MLVHRVAIDLLVVREIVLELANRALGLDAPHNACCDLAREVRVLAVSLEGAPVERHAGEVDAWPFLEVPAGAARLPPHHRAVPERDRGIERGGEAEWRW